MLANLLWLLGFVAVVVLLAWLTRRAWKSKRAWLKYPGTVLLGLLTLVVALVTLVIGKGMYDLYRPYPVAGVNITIARTPEEIARGEHLASVLCASCHSENGELPLSGGNNFSEEIGLPLGDVYPANITPGGKLKELSDADVYRILRTGIDRNGRLTAMSFFASRYLSDEDTSAIMAYLRTSKAVEGSRPSLNPSPLLAAFVALGFLKPEAAWSPIQPVSAPPKAATKEYGQYVLSFTDCKACHGPTLSGDAPPPAPPGPNLTLIVPQWSKDEFFRTMRTGIDPSGHQIQPPMPWQEVGRLDDVELAALYEYLHGLTPVKK
jgi:mono/diheme cytochrome c family protein